MLTKDERVENSSDSSFDKFIELIIIDRKRKKEKLIGDQSMHVKHNCINQSCQYTISIIVSVMDSIRIAERHKMSVYNNFYERVRETVQKLTRNSYC